METGKGNSKHCQMWSLFVERWLTYFNVKMVRFSLTKNKISFHYHWWNDIIIYQSINSDMSQGWITDLGDKKVLLFWDKTVKKVFWNILIAINIATHWRTWRTKFKIVLFCSSSLTLALERSCIHTQNQ